MSESMFSKVPGASNGIRNATVAVVKGENGRLGVDVAAATIGPLEVVQLATAQRGLFTFSLDLNRLVIAFPTSSLAPQVCQGAALNLGEIIVLGPGGRVYHRMEGAGALGWLTIPPTLLKYWCGVLSGGQSSNPTPGGVVRPPRSAFDRFVRTHKEALSVFNGGPEILTYAEAYRAGEQDLIHTLVSCLTSSGKIAESDGAARQRRRHSSVMHKLDEYLDSSPNMSMKVSDISEQLNVSERTLRNVCKRFTGESPRSYSALRRMNAARATLLNASPGATSVSNVAEVFGFRSAGRFAALYRQLFGEYPTVTLRQSMAENE